MDYKEAFVFLSEILKNEIEQNIKNDPDLISNEDKKRSEESTYYLEDLEGLLDELDILQVRWENLFRRHRLSLLKSKKWLGRIPHRGYLDQQDFKLFVLQALVDLGGEAQKQKVLDQVELILRENNFKGNEYNYHKNAENARNILYDEYLTGKGRGIWKITEKGENYLLKNNK